MKLVLGASGFLGPALREAMAASQVAFTYQSRAVPGGLHFDARSSSVRQLVEAIGTRPSAAVILLGITSIDACARDPAGTAKINVEGIVRVIDELRALGIVPVFTSSDAVFDGTHALWREDEEVQPILTYGRQKREVERYLTSLPEPWLIVRLPKLLAAARDSRCVLTGWVEALGRPGRILCATDQYFTPADAGDVAQAITRLVDAGASGLYHLGGPQRLSRRELLEEVAREYRKHGDVMARIVDCSLREIPVVEPRPRDLSMDTSRYRSRFGPGIRPASEAARLAVRRILESA